MERIELRNLTDDQFQKYLGLLKLIKNKYEKESFRLDYDWNEYRDYYFKEYSDGKIFKSERLKIAEENKEKSLWEYIIFDHERPVAWMSCKRVSGDYHQFIFDYEGSDITDNLLAQIFEGLKFYLKETGAKSISYWANYKEKADAFRRAGFNSADNNVNSILQRKDIDFEKLRDITENTENIKNYDLKLFREIPEEIYDRYVDFMNEARPAMNLYRPHKKETEIYTKESLLKSIRRDAEDGAPIYMYVIFDRDTIAAFCKVYIERIDDSVFIQHCGGLTGVSAQYRGRGFAKFLKAKMYLKILEDYPDFRHILTDTFPWNKYMYRINEEFGFRILDEASSFDITSEFLEKIIMNSNSNQTQLTQN